jgi:hypothetical protein
VVRVVTGGRSNKEEFYAMKREERRVNRHRRREFTD